ncbi:recombinase family protein [Nocardia sp. NPDC051463]|uniref:recombinase family protein n=1 Tax=Nocardia sp. NPDC051463 TaxID=3154845 RepID=UPI00344ED588
MGRLRNLGYGRKNVLQSPGVQQSLSACSHTLRAIADKTHALDFPDPLALDGDALDPIGGGAFVGYGRVSTTGQLLDRQIHALAAAGFQKIFTDKKRHKGHRTRRALEVPEYMRPGDTLVVRSLDRLGRSLQDLISIVTGLRKRGIGFRSRHEAIDTATPGGRLVFHVFAALAEFIRELIVQGANEGLAAARARGQ